MFGPNGGQKGRLQSNKPLGVNNKLQHKHGNNHRNCQAVATTWLHYATDCSREKKSGRASEMQPELLSKPQRFPATPHGFFFPSFF